MKTLIFAALLTLSTACQAMAEEKAPVYFNSHAASKNALSLGLEVPRVIDDGGERLPMLFELNYDRNLEAKIKHNVGAFAGMGGHVADRELGHASSEFKFALGLDAELGEINDKKAILIGGAAKILLAICTDNGIGEKRARHQFCIAADAFAVAGASSYPLRAGAGLGLYYQTRVAHDAALRIGPEIRGITLPKSDDNKDLSGGQAMLGVALVPR